MTIQEAFEELKRAYPGEDIRVSCRVDNFAAEGATRVSYEVYRSKGQQRTHGTGKTWKEAMNDLIEPDPPIIEPCDDGEPPRKEVDLEQIAHEMRLEDARLEAAEVRKEMREAGKI